MLKKYNIEVGERIKEARLKKGISIEELGKMVNLHKSTVSRYEKGSIQALSIEKLKEFAKVLDTPAEYILGWEDKPNNKNQKLETFNKTNSFMQRYLNESANEIGVDVDSIGRNARRWQQELGIVDFTDEELTELINYAKYLISKRKD